MASKKKFDKYIRMINKFKGKNILVVGDIMLDEYVWGSATRISPEAPVPVVEIRKRTYHPGGAANTVSNILSLGARASLLGIVGKDADGRRLKQILRDGGINTDNIITDSSRPTTSKVRIIAHGQQVMRADQEDASPMNNRIAGRMVKALGKIIGQIDGIAVSDYNKGVISPAFMGNLLTMAKEAGVIVAADIKPPNTECFKGVNIITPNRKEASAIAEITIKDEESLKEAGKRLRRRLGVEAALITLGEDGMALFGPGSDFVAIPALSTQVYDVTGAGDTVLSTLTVALSAGIHYRDAVELANFAAGVVVRKRGTTSVGQDELKNFIETVLQ